MLGHEEQVFSGTWRVGTVLHANIKSALEVFDCEWLKALEAYIVAFFIPAFSTHDSHKALWEKDTLAIPDVSVLLVFLPFVSSLTECALSLCWSWLWMKYCTTTYYSSLRWQGSPQHNVPRSSSNCSLTRWLRTNPQVSCNALCPSSLPLTIFLLPYVVSFQMFPSDSIFPTAMCLDSPDAVPAWSPARQLPSSLLKHSLFTCPASSWTHWFPFTHFPLLLCTSCTDNWGPGAKEAVSHPSAIKIFWFVSSQWVVATELLIQEGGQIKDAQKLIFFSVTVCFLWGPASSVSSTIVRGLGFVVCAS